MTDGTVGTASAYYAFLTGYYRVSGGPSPPRDVSVDTNDVIVGERRIPRASIRDAVIVPGPPRVLRLVRRRAADIDLLFSDASAADELARRLGLDPAHHALRVRLPSLLFPAGLLPGIVVTVAGGAILASLLGDTAGSIATALLAGAVVALGFAPRWITIGLDGIYDQWLWRRKFTKLTEVFMVTGYHFVPKRFEKKRAEHRVTVMLHDTSSFVLEGNDADTIDIIAERIRRVAALAPKARDEEVRHVEAQLARAERSPAEWLQHLRALLQHGERDYRSSAITREDLRRLLADPTRSAELRVAAAAALAATADEEERVRISEAGGATGDPRVRVAIDRVLAAEDDEAIGQALAAAAADE